MEYFLLIWGFILLLCIIEAIIFTKYEEEGNQERKEKRKNV
tara:strand:- start:762 stop:884 length:123 start_codon:yes stop_codon:yes gene_type:complete